ncbi:ABC1 family-domain-containing protein, partial [Dichotomocladium elegans]
EDARFAMKAIRRCGRAALTGATMGLDYTWTIAISAASHGDLEEAKRQWHLRSARRVLNTFQSLGGIYIKWGQHLSSMVFILPDEWTSTLAALQDRCETLTSPAAIRKLFLTDVGQPLDDLFDEFDFTPIGVASLAQVHRARLRSTGRRVAVKIQHPHLDEFCRIDISTVSWIFSVIQRINSNFGFYWVAEDMRESLPQELDFRIEADHAEKVKKQFNIPEAHHRSTALVIPEIIWAKRRILCMEFMDGARVDDISFMKKNGIDPMVVSSELVSIFSEMMKTLFYSGLPRFSDPGNVMIRPNAETGTSVNFDIILLDHGVYRSLPDNMRIDYARLWTSLIEGDEVGIEKYCARVGGTDYRLLASMLTGREWHTIAGARLTSARDAEEIDRVARKDTARFLRRITNVLSSLPRVMLLLLKTGDLLRSVEESL